VQLRKLRRGIEARRSIVDRYLDRLKGLDAWEIPFSDNREESSDHLMVVLAEDSAVRDAARVRLAGAGIQTSFHYPLVTQFTAFKDFASEGLGRSESFASRALTLPLSPAMRPEDVDTVCAILCAPEA
jgi:dTDP-4-amino-4,6-dideoxygalactose transaminase